MKIINKQLHKYKSTCLTLDITFFILRIAVLTVLSVKRSQHHKDTDYHRSNAEDAEKANVVDNIDLSSNQWTVKWLRSSYKLLGVCKLLNCVIFCVRKYIG